MTEPVARQETTLDRFRAFRRSIGRPPVLRRETVTVRGLDFAVYRTPDPATGAAPLVCVNGGLIFDHRLLWPALSPLAATRQLIFYDQRGRGHSSVPPGARTSRIEFDALDLAALVPALGGVRPHLLGHSWGGGICMLATAHLHDSIQSLTLIDPVGLTNDWFTQLTDRALATLTEPAQRRLRIADAAVRPDAPTAADPAALSEFAAAIYPAWFADQSLTALLAPPASTSVTGAAVSARLRRDGYDWRTVVPPAAVPTLLLHGDRDLIPVSVAQATAAALGRRATLTLIPDAGHNPFWEQPSIVFPAIEQFLLDSDNAPLR
jgi:proline iminopeptidase